MWRVPGTTRSRASSSLSAALLFGNSTSKSAPSAICRRKALVGATV
ncbi:Uncharacterised protein [Bordetella pertussis]|nr:Uncharacterised protein [Bordetella pertussis]